MQRHDFLREIHQLAKPRNYLEIGVNDGTSLALSHVPSIAIDPAFRITVPIECDLRLVKATSDAFFAEVDPLAHLHPNDGPAPIDFAFIDGMHLFEFALRDFINVERYSTWSTVIVLDDMLPRNVDEAARERHTHDWTGDVFKLIRVLARHRPDLLVVPIDTEPTGMLVVLGADADNRTLETEYPRLLAEHVVPDPQVLPRTIVERSCAVAPEQVLDPFFWRELSRAREEGASREEGVALLRERLPAPLAADLDWSPAPVEIQRPVPAPVTARPTKPSVSRPVERASWPRRTFRRVMPKTVRRAARWPARAVRRKLGQAS